jgi:hypothetical protein
MCSGGFFVWIGMHGYGYCIRAYRVHAQKCADPPLRGEEGHVLNLTSLKLSLAIVQGRVSVKSAAGMRIPAAFCVPVIHVGQKKRSDLFPMPASFEAGPGVYELNNQEDLDDNRTIWLE